MFIHSPNKEILFIKCMIGFSWVEFSCHAAGGGSCRFALVPIETGEAEMDVGPFFFTQPNLTHQLMDPTQSIHHTNADTSTVEPTFLRVLYFTTISPQK